jgi:hypothetical protein
MMIDEVEFAKPLGEFKKRDLHLQTEINIYKRKKLEVVRSQFELKNQTEENSIVSMRVRIQQLESENSRLQTENERLKSEMHEIKESAHKKGSFFKLLV